MFEKNILGDFMGDIDLERFMRILVLFAEFKTGHIPVEIVGEKFFKMSPAVAKRRAADGTFPVACYKADDESQKTQWVVSIFLLEKVLTKQYNASIKLWCSFHNIGKK